MNENKIIILLVGLGVLAVVGSLSFGLSNKGLNKLKRFEALRLKPYKDSGGKFTIGWGHLIKRPEENYLLNKNGISAGKATQLLRADVQVAEKAVKRLVKAPLSGNQIDALISFVYNIGIDAFAQSTMLRYINAKQYQKAANEFPAWRYVNKKENAGLLARRAEEQSMFLG